ncbi:cyclin-H [Hetaerina americana]|uniref:cyclin-H n=1 Tax=Hetaerina americana TaxID=62018 RepID=UPI003A7F3533
MYPSSTQKKFWTFSEEGDLDRSRLEANRKFVIKHGGHMSEEQQERFFLTPSEESLLRRQYELQLREFCRKFQPPMPRSVAGTSFHYFKRFYLHNSVMDYHPKEILVTCVYLACKVEEFNVSISQFVGNIRGDREKASDIILNNELLLMQQLNYHLTVHNPFRPIEGLLIDIKTRCPTLKDPERLRPGMEEFLDRCLWTDACLVYSPSQLALAALLHSTSKVQENLDSYVTDTLFGGEKGASRLPGLVEAVRRIRSMAKSVEPPPRYRIRPLEKKLERCRTTVKEEEAKKGRGQRSQDFVDEDDMLRATAEERSERSSRSSRHSGIDECYPLPTNSPGSQ